MRLPLMTRRFLDVLHALAPVLVRGHVQVIACTSVAAAATFADASLDVVFLDADHSYEAVKADIRAWLPKVKPGGLLAGDDYCYPGTEGVKRAVDELIAAEILTSGGVLTVPERFVDHVSGWWEYRLPVSRPAVAIHDSAEVGPFLAALNMMAPPELSVITPLHAPGNAFIRETWESLLAQTEAAFEWIVLENKGGHVPDDIRADWRVRVVRIEGLLGIGALKRKLCELARAPYVVELDHDDVLAPTALKKVAAALEHAEFCYSDFSEFHDKTHKPGVPFRADCGWVTYPVGFRGETLIAHRAPPVSPQNIRLVEWAPNHLRAWRAAAYWEVGGHDASMIAGDDHDLMLRFFLAGKRFEHLPEPLYFYRLHPANAVKTHNAEIRKQTVANYEKHCWELAERSGRVWVSRDTACKAEMKAGEWLFLLCPKSAWTDRALIPLMKGDFAVAMLYDRGFEVECHAIRLGPGYAHYGEQCGD